MTKLLPCPFCGGEASKRLFYKGKYRVHCNVCDAHSGDVCDTEAEAIEAWNTRAPMSYEDLKILLDELGVSERTCRNISTTNNFRCSKCDAVDLDFDKPSYCHGCGAKVVSE